MQIHVTQEHIDKGERCHSCKCPVALAIHEETGMVAAASLELVHLGHGMINKRVFLPSEVTDFIRRFDRKEPVQPFTFELNV